MPPRRTPPRTRGTPDRFEALVAGIDGVVWESDARTLQFTFVSPQAERMFGYPREQWLERDFWVQHVHPDDRAAAVESCVDATRAKRNHTFEYRMLTARGDVVWIRDVVTVLVERGEPTRLLGIMVDVTEHRLAEIALRETVDRLRLATHAGNVGLWDWDLRDNQVVFSREWKSQLGHDEHEIRGEYTEWESRLHPDDLAPSLAALRAYLAGETPEYAVEFRMRHKDGTWRWIRAQGDVLRNEAGQTIRMLGCHIDITERKKAEHDQRIHLWFLESLDRVNRAIQGASDVEAVMRDVLAVLLEIFGADRAVLSYPCDPTAPSWRVVAERVRPPYHGALGDYPVDAWLTRLIEFVLAARRPVTLGSHGEHPLHPDAGALFEVRSMLATAIHPRLDRPYLFSLHQCSHERVWAPEEMRLFEEVGRRLADGLTTHTILRSLRQSEQRLLEAERVAHLGYWERDYARDVITWSDEAYRIWGMEPGTPLDGTDLMQRIHPDDRVTVLSSIASSVEDGAPHDLEYRALRADGEIRILHSQGNLLRGSAGEPLRFFGTVQDITERRHAEQAIRESHNLLNAVLEGTDDAVFVKDLEGRYLMVNSAAAHNIGRPAAEVVGRDDVALWGHTAIVDTILDQDREVIASGRSRTFEMDLAGRDGGTHTLLTRKSVFRDANGRVGGLIGIARDVTEQKHLEEQFRQAQKMEAVGRLAGGVAHDFNNLLTVIHGFTQLVFDRLPAHDEGREPLAEVIKAAERAANLTRQLLVFSRKQALRPRTVDVNALLGDLLRLLRRLIGEDIEFSLTLHAVAAFTAVDPGQFEQAIINLAVNARDAMPEGGRIAIETSVTDVGERLNPAARAGRYVHIAIRDSGAGMDEATQTRIFEPFFTTKAPGQGTGLGLAMVYGFVEQSGGFIDVTSKPEAGTTFDIYLPAAMPAEAAADAPERETTRVPMGTETILIVEDESAVRSFARAVLEASGYQVLVAADGEEGLARGVAHEGPIDLLITDLVMPRLGGRQLAEALRRSRPNVRLLFMSGYTDQPLPPANGGRSAFLQKPFVALDLLGTVRRVLDAPAQP